MGNRVTLEDIAKACGVSKGLVSRALAGKYNVGEQTREIILKKVAELGYDQKNLRSRSAPLKKVLLVISSRIMLKEAYWQPIIRALVHTLDQQMAMLDYFIYHEENITQEDIDRLVETKTDAFVLIHTNPRIITDKLKLTRKPIVEVDPKSFHADGVTQVKFSNYDSMFVATRKLIEDGHRILAFYGSDLHATSFRERHEGFLACIQSHAAEGVKGFSCIFDNQNLSYADEGMLTKLLKKEKPTALICANDIIALNAYKTIRRLGLRIPEDVSVIGFDNIQEGEVADPPLSTFNVPREDLGREVANYLLGTFHQRQLAYSQIVVRCPFIERGSILKKGDTQHEIPSDS